MVLWAHRLLLLLLFSSNLPNRLYYSFVHPSIDFHVCHLVYFLWYMICSYYLLSCCMVSIWFGVAYQLNVHSVHFSLHGWHLLLTLPFVSFFLQLSSIIVRFISTVDVQYFLLNHATLDLYKTLHTITFWTHPTLYSSLFRGFESNWCMRCLPLFLAVLIDH